MDGIRNTEVFPIDLGIRLWKLDISNIQESEIRGIPNRWESDYRSQITGVRLMSEVTRGQVDNDNNSQSQYLNISIIVQGGGLYIQV